VFDALPAELRHARLVQTANDDKTARVPDFLVLSFGRRAFVHVLFDSRRGSPPAWLSSFVRESLRVTTDESERSGYGYIAYGRHYDSCEAIRLGGNEDDGSHSMYIVAVEYESTLTDVCPRDLAFDVGADRHLVECDASTHRCRTTQARRPSWILGRWRAGPGPARLDVNHRTIDALDLAQADLALADFISTAAPSARIVGSDLSSAELRSANLRDAHITSSDL